MVKRRHGLNRCRYRGEAGMHPWVGLGVIADNLVNIGRALQRQAHVAPQLIHHAVLGGLAASAPLTGHLKSLIFALESS